MFDTTRGHASSHYLLFKIRLQTAQKFTRERYLECSIILLQRKIGETMKVPDKRTTLLIRGHEAIYFFL